MRRRRIVREKEGTRCRFCRSKDLQVDYKNLEMLEKLLTPQGKIVSRKRSGSCAKHQRQVKRAIKHARFLALLQYVGE